MVVYVVTIEDCRMGKNVLERRVDGGVDLWRVPRYGDFVNVYDAYYS